MTLTTTILYFERKIQNTTEGLSYDCFNWLEKVASNIKDNVIVIANYIMSMKTETNLSNNYRRSIIILLSKFWIFFKNQKIFISFLDSFRKIESVDTLHKWISTYNIPNQLDEILKILRIGILKFIVDAV